MAEDRHRIGGGGGHNIFVLPHPRRGAIVKHHAIFAQHQAVAAFAHAQTAERVGIDLIQESSGIGALNIDLAQSGHIADADRFARGQNLAVDRLAPFGFARFGHPLRAQPIAHFDKNRALFLRPFVRGCQAEGFELLPPTTPTQGAQSHRRIRRAVDRGAGVGNGLARQPRHHGQAQHVAGLALIGCHAKRCIAFQMLDRDEVFLMRQFDVFDGDIVLRVNPSAVCPFDIPHRRDPHGCIFGLGQVSSLSR